MTQRVLEWTTARLREGEAVALASVITAQGSVPGKPGAHMAVTDSEVYLSLIHILTLPTIYSV